MSKKPIVQDAGTKIINMITVKLPAPVNTLLTERLRAIEKRAAEITGHSYTLTYVLGKRLPNVHGSIQGILIPGSIPEVREEFLELEKDMQTLEDDMLIIGNALKAIVNLPTEGLDILAKILDKIPKPLLALLPEDAMNVRTHDNLVCKELIEHPVFKTQYARIDDKIHYYLATRYIV